jgi:serine/threonine-protein kinase
VVHRDLKPSNIFLSTDHHGQELVKIMDFGLACTDGPSNHSLMEEYIIGTPEWMSPEQARGEKNLSPRSDIYTLGLIVYSMLTGHKAYTYPDNTPLQVVCRRAKAAMSPVRPSTFQRALPSHIDDAILCALDPDPANRPASAKDFYLRLAQA